MNIANLYPQPRNSHKKLFILQHLKSADPACSKGSASKEKLLAGRGKKQDVRNKEVRNQLQAARGKFWELGQAVWSQFLVDSESHVRHGPQQAAGAIRPSLPWCFNVAKGSVLEAWVSSLELVSCGFSSAGWQAKCEGFKLVSGQFRRQRLALWAAGGGG